MEKYGLLGLFFSTFASSTILPIPSEVVVATFVALKYNPWLILSVASVGNVLGSLTTYALGYFGLTRFLGGNSHLDSAKVQFFYHKSSRYGEILAFLSFVPFLGDIFILALGFARYNIYKAIFFIALGKTLRYALVIFGINQILNWFLI